MSQELYTASKTRSNRPGWSIGFRHPLRKDSRGRIGLKVRRGLGTSDETGAEVMVNEMNTILTDSAWWNASKRKEAELRFSKPVVDAFYDEIQAGHEDSENIREGHIHLPNKDEGFTRVLFVGTTGAGKTSLLRQLIGSDPDDDRFPSTAPAKTTIADIEVVQSPGDFEAIVTFFSEFQTLASIEECVVDAALAVLEKAEIEKIADRFLNHRDQKFRLSYLLGGWRKESSVEEVDDMSFDPDSEPVVFDDEAVLSELERNTNQKKVAQFIERITELTKTVETDIAADLGVDRRVSNQDRDAARELIEEHFEQNLVQREAFHELVQDILDDVRLRFDRVEKGDLNRRRSGWPDYWLFKSEDRDEFIRQIRWFSSNYWPQFGRLLTPLVDGIRVRGPLFGKFSEQQPKVALIDGQGLGHTPDSSASVTTRITRRFPQVDVVLLVDNAQQPMQAAPLSVLRAVASSGHEAKLAIAFTHFDQIKGQNLPTFAAKRAHVMASVLNALSSLRDVLGTSIVKVIEQGLNSRCFMLGGVDRQLTKLPTKAAEYMTQQLTELVAFFGNSILPPPPAESRPIYDPTGINFAVQEAVEKFQGPWLARLGMGSYEGFRKEHWTRIKALNRRIAGELDTEYDTLRPVADLVTQLRESLSRFLNSPIAWTINPEDEAASQAAIAHIRQTVDISLHELAIKRLVEAHLTKWRTAHDEFVGSGSTRQRAVAIQGIYDAAAPLPDSVMTPPSVAFLAEIRQIIIGAIRASGGDVRLNELS